MLDAHDDPRRHDEHGFTRQGFADKSANRSSAAKAAPAVRMAASDSAEPARRPRLELSLTQILGSTSAAVTAAFLGSRLGVAGTLIGAALASVISVVGGAIYTSSIKATRRRMAQVIVAVRSPDTEPVPEPAPVLMPLAGRRSADHAGSRNTSTRRPVLRGLAIGAVLSAAVFAGALAIVTGYETVSGTALSGGQVGGLTILGGSGVDTGSTGDSGPSTKSGNAEKTGTSVQTSHNRSSATTSSGTPAGTAAVTTNVSNHGAGTTVTTTVTANGSSSTGATTPTPATPTTTSPVTTTAAPGVPTGTATGTSAPTTADGTTSSDSSSPSDPATTTTATTTTATTTPAGTTTAGTTTAGTTTAGTPSDTDTSSSTGTPPGPNTPR